MEQRNISIVLIGMMGTGKSTAGRWIAEQLGYEFVDLDHEIEVAAGKRIPDLFAEDGEPAFRNLESAVLAKVLSCSKRVIATGGGAVLSESNCELMKRQGWVAALTAGAESIVERVREDQGRPLLAGGDLELKVRTILEERKDCYRFADLTVDTTGISAEEAGRQILMHYRV
ncbi:shikimate kinase [Paenibacillus sp. F411]|uniref:shikimate kinase n=1 Tax=Paenibacillus sp. F411 TaxID=2820239 RepID=UPI001AAF2857|nr:shikimate kinase [Paenibacillus sp. F411]MBO2944929.1 shikimate kinase [Paenibacillus sp. F411]